MNVLRVGFIVFLALAPVLFVSAGQEVLSPLDGLPQGLKLKGRVLDAHNAPLAHAKIRLESARFFHETQSGVDGDFEANLPAGTYRLTVEREGFQRFELSPLHLNANVCELINVHLEALKQRGVPSTERKEN